MKVEQLSSLVSYRIPLRNTCAAGLVIQKCKGRISICFKSDGLSSPSQDYIKLILLQSFKSPSFNTSYDNIHQVYLRPTTLPFIESLLLVPYEQAF